MILADTSVWVDFLRGEDSHQRRMLHGLIEDEEDIAISEIIFTEILQGIKNDREFQAIKDYLLEFPMYGPKGI
ncbi:MAG TPA: PIN domain-containing protein, partial [Patescibacteria group bacterium]|nr:PIN domain-containing protein [Patescibacteria group bacterium]